MKKLLLLGAMAFGAFLSAEAQNNGTTCALATPITANGTITAATFDGTYAAYCQGSRTGIKAKWYRYTATANGEVTISSNLAANNGTTYTNDTRVQVLRSSAITCATGTLEACVATADDIAPNATPANYLSTVTFPVASGKTYYIQWDNYWNGTDVKGFQFTFAFTAVSCIRIGENDAYLPFDYTTTDASLAWVKAIGNPPTYNIDYSTNLTAAAGAGTIVNTPAGTETYSTVTLSGLPASSNFRYFVRGSCGFTQSAWQGPFYGYLAKSGNYTHTFDAADNYEDGFIGDFTWFNSTASTTPANYADGGIGGVMYTFNATAASNEWGYTRGFSLTAGTVVTIKYKTRLYSAATPATMSLKLSAGLDQVATAQTLPIQTVAPAGTASFTQHTATWTVPATGVYYFGFNNNSPASTLSTAIFLDTVEVTLAPASAESFVASQLTVFPNPATNMVTVSAVDALVNGVELIDINGRTVKTVKLNGVAEAQINISDLSTGVYMMNISSDKGSATKKVVKQ